MKGLLIATALPMSPLCLGGSVESELVSAAIDRTDERVI